MKTFTLKVTAKAAAQMADLNLNTAQVIDTLVSTKKTVVDTKTKKVKVVKAVAKNGQTVSLAVNVHNLSNTHFTVETVGKAKTKTKAKAFTVTLELTDENLVAFFGKKAKKKQ